LGPRARSTSEIVMKMLVMFGALTPVQITLLV
jgi:hypothetical protein